MKGIEKLIYGGRKQIRDRLVAGVGVGGGGGLNIK